MIHSRAGERADERWEEQPRLAVSRSPADHRDPTDPCTTEENGPRVNRDSRPGSPRRRPARKPRAGRARRPAPLRWHQVLDVGHHGRSSKSIESPKPRSWLYQNEISREKAQFSALFGLQAVTMSSRMYQQSCCYKFQMKFELRMAS